jgi:hypothetical protein
VANEPVVLEVDSRAAVLAFDAFEQWAGSGQVVVSFGPDTLMAVDWPDRRGLLHDEIYFVTIWAGAGGDQLVELLRRLTEEFVIRDPAMEPLPKRTLELVLTKGAPIDEVRHLI